MPRTLPTGLASGSWGRFCDALGSLEEGLEQVGPGGSSRLAGGSPPEGLEQFERHLSTLASSTSPESESESAPWALSWTIMGAPFETGGWVACCFVLTLEKFSM